MHFLFMNLSSKQVSYFLKIVKNFHTDNIGILVLYSAHLLNHICTVHFLYFAMQKNLCDASVIKTQTHPH